MLFTELSARHVENTQTLFFVVALVITVVAVTITARLTKKNPNQVIYVGAVILAAMAVILVLGFPLFV